MRTKDKEVWCWVRCCILFHTNKMKMTLRKGSCSLCTDDKAAKSCKKNPYSALTRPTICVHVTARRNSGFQVVTWSVTAPLCWPLLPSVHLCGLSGNSSWDLKVHLGLCNLVFSCTDQQRHCTLQTVPKACLLMTYKSFFRSAWQIWKTPQRAGRACLSRVWGWGAPADV